MRPSDGSGCRNHQVAAGFSGIDNDNGTIDDSRDLHRFGGAHYRRGVYDNQVVFPCGLGEHGCKMH